MTIKIGLLRADDVAPDLAKIYGEYPQMIKQLVLAANQARGAQAETLEFSTYAVNREQYPADINEVDAYIISGSKSSVYDPEPWIKKLHNFVETLHNRQKKTVGICFGHQIIASALGGKTEKAAAGWVGDGAGERVYCARRRGRLAAVQGYPGSKRHVRSRRLYRVP